jgi:hypothetical protein
MGIFIYDKRSELLKGYKYMNNTHLLLIDLDFNYYLPLENTSKMAFIIDDPTFIKKIAKRNLDGLKMDKDYLEILDVASKMTDDNNPILFIYEFKD